jgi:hypothetical protein
LNQSERVQVGLVRHLVAQRVEIESRRVVQGLDAGGGTQSADAADIVPHPAVERPLAAQVRRDSTARRAGATSAARSLPAPASEWRDPSSWSTTS